MEIRLHVQGDRACFKRVEFVDDLVSYDVITPLAARRIFESIYTTPGIRWCMEEIRVLRPIRSTWMSLADAGHAGVARITGGKRDRRMANVLVDVAYVLTATLGTAAPATSHLASFNGRLASRRFIRSPYLGIPDFTAEVALVDGTMPTSDLAGAVDLSWMLYDVPPDGAGGAQLFRPMMVDGVIDLRQRKSLMLAR